MSPTDYDHSTWRLEEVPICQFSLSATKDTPAHAFASRSCRPVERLLNPRLQWLGLGVWRGTGSGRAGGRVEDENQAEHPSDMRLVEALARHLLTSGRRRASRVYIRRATASQVLRCISLHWAVGFGGVQEDEFQIKRAFARAVFFDTPACGICTF
ncbi:hypothetical protein FJTKL_15159 [Diaporthe vaccinii]|uniref:Uncharacterized protein n=1 Tax=Diaporthe vaccinii TaxID=105482 RepID=A0ABR4E617_9PEZI